MVKRCGKTSILSRRQRPRVIPSWLRRGWDTPAKDRQLLPPPGYSLDGEGLIPWAGARPVGLSLCLCRDSPGAPSAAGRTAGPGCWRKSWAREGGSTAKISGMESRGGERAAQCCLQVLLSLLGDNLSTAADAPVAPNQLCCGLYTVKVQGSRGRYRNARSVWDCSVHGHWDAPTAMPGTS